MLDQETINALLEWPGSMRADRPVLLPCQSLSDLFRQSLNPPSNAR